MLPPTPSQREISSTDSDDSDDEGIELLLSSNSTNPTSSTTTALNTTQFTRKRLILFLLILIPSVLLLATDSSEIFFLYRMNYLFRSKASTSAKSPSAKSSTPTSPSSPSSEISASFESVNSNYYDYNAHPHVHLSSDLYKFTDMESKTRPSPSSIQKLLKSYPSNDVPDNGWDAKSWQVDITYVNHFLDEAIKFVDRLLDSIIREHQPADSDMKSFDEAAVKGVTTMTGEAFAKGLFNFHGFDDEDDINKQSLAALPVPISGYINKHTAYPHLVRSLLHCIQTNTTFTVVLAGHSAAQASGNNFNQSYTQVISTTLFPIFQRLGIPLVVRNNAQGGIGTFQTSLGYNSIISDTPDFVIWDSWMTEANRGVGAIDLFYLQSMLNNGGKMPFLLQAHMSGCQKSGDFCNSLMKYSKFTADLTDKSTGVGVGHMTWQKNEGLAKALPFPDTCGGDVVGLDQTKLPKMLRDFNCPPGCQRCRATAYNSVCWVDGNALNVNGTDLVPPTKQRPSAKGQASWHPGYKDHQLRGRIISHLILEALDLALTKYQTVAVAEGVPLPSEYWHTGERSKAQKKRLLKTYDFSKCTGLVDKEFNLTQNAGGKSVGERVCKLPMSAYTEWTPRASTGMTLRSIIVEGLDEGNRVGDLEEIYTSADKAYEGWGTEGGEDVVSVSWGFEGKAKGKEKRGRGFAEAEAEAEPIKNKRTRNLAAKAVKPPSDKWEFMPTTTGICDGTMFTHCGRMAASDCLMSGQHDGKAYVRCSLKPDGSGCGVLKMVVKDVKNGLLLVNLGIDPQVLHLKIKVKDMESGKVVGDKVVEVDNSASEKKFFYNDMYINIMNDEGKSVAEGKAGKDYEVAVEILKGKGGEEVRLTHVYYS